MPATQYEELCETIVINALSSGTPVASVVRHDDASQDVVNEMISVQAERAEPLLEGPRGYRVECTLQMQSGTATALATIHAESLLRLTTAATLLTAATAAGMVSGDDLYVVNEEISGDRSDTKNLRKRTITVPFIIRKS